MVTKIRVVAGVLLDEDKNILLGKRSEEKELGGFWEFPGGKIESDESPKECLEREIKEELDIEIRIIEKLCGFNYDYGTKEIKFIVFLAERIKGEIDLSAHKEVSWVNEKELNTYELAPADKKILKRLKKYFD